MKQASIAKRSAAGLVRGESSASEECSERPSALFKTRLSVTWNAPLQKISSRLEVVVCGGGHYYNGDTNKAIVMYAHKEMCLISSCHGLLPWKHYPIFPLMKQHFLKKQSSS